jgi:hypothetical protein
MLNQTHLRNCDLTTRFQPVMIGSAAGIRCQTCGKRWIIHYCSESHSGLGGLQTREPELLPLLVDFGVNEAFDAYCPGCRQAISVVNTASEAIRPYSPQVSNALDQVGQLIAVGMVLVTAVGIGGWVARQLR